MTAGASTLESLVRDAPSWMSDAVCVVNPELWYSLDNGGQNAAKRLCKTCDVRGDCLEYALDNNETHGIWGGLSVNQRAKLRRKRLKGM